MQGAFSATQDQISWVLTSYIVASAVMLPATGWLAGRLGRRRLFLVAVGGFTLFSLFCGAAESLPAEVLLRIGQGACGAFLIPLSQAIMLDAYPPEEHGKAMAFWGMGVVLGPVIGPTLGGYLTDALSWRWVFFVNIPVGLLALLGGLTFLPKTPPADHPRPLDGFGFLALALGVGAMQMMLDRGERLDWFELARDRDRGDRDGSRPLFLRCAQPDQREPDRRPAPDARSQLRARHAAGVPLRHADSGADGADAAVPAGPAGLSDRDHRPLAQPARGRPVRGDDRARPGRQGARLPAADRRGLPAARGLELVDVALEHGGRRGRGVLDRPDAGPRRRLDHRAAWAS